MGKKKKKKKDDPKRKPKTPTGKPRARRGPEPVDELGSEAASAPKRERIAEQLAKTVIAIPLVKDLGDAEPTDPFDVIIDLNLLHPGGLASAKQIAEAQIRQVAGGADLPIDKIKSDLCPQYVFARLTKDEIIRLVRTDAALDSPSIYKVWPDFEVQPLLTHTLATVKADAAQVAFSAKGEGIVWAVIDSGIDGRHPHFAKWKNLALSAPIEHMDFARQEGTASLAVPADGYGHGTHVAGIIGGDTDGKKLGVVRRELDDKGDIQYRSSLEALKGVAPQCKLVSLRVLDDRGQGKVSNVIAALAYVQKVNNYGRWRRIHGVNMSLGYEFDPEWFACGQSPLCIEVDRLVGSGVVVVAAAGNTGYGTVHSSFKGAVAAGLDLTINDPGNADRAITDGSTHRESPHVYGVSYFSSKGPTGDGRLKPDLVAPGERVISCAAGGARARIEETLARRAGGGPATCHYLEDSGTSMAAPHVSGAVAAFLSVKREFIGRPDKVKKIFLDSATDLQRERYFQGHGMVDLMRAIQRV